MSSSESKPFHYWSERRHKIKTDIGQWHAGVDVTVRGQSLLHNLIYEINAAQLQVLNITGRIIDERLAQWVEKIRFLMAYPDSRLWCNFLASLAAVQGASPVAGAVLSFLAADSKAYGSQVQSIIIRTIEQLYATYERNQDFAEVVALFPLREGIPVIPGFFRPICRADERLAPMQKITAQLGFDDGKYVQFVMGFSQYLEAQYQCALNSAGYCCAFLMDQNFSADEIYAMTASCVETGALACYFDHIEDQENGFLPLHCDDIRYTGPELRPLGDLSGE